MQPASGRRRGATLNETVTAHMSASFVRLQPQQTVAAALQWLREHPPRERIFYFYVIDEADRLQGVVPARRLLHSPADQTLDQIMIREVLTVPATASAREAGELFLTSNLLAFPVIDANGRMVGVIDVEHFAQELAQFRARNPLRPLIEPLTRFMQIEAASGIVLLASAIAAMILANSPWSAAYAKFWHQPLGLSFGSWSFAMSLNHWINDGLMTLFFFVMGLEIKWEFLFGELNNRYQATLPVVAAIGGMVVPALMYVAMIGLSRSPGIEGWGIPTATDIAFAVGVLTLLGSRVPRALTVLLLALAIVDDIGATLIIALAYGQDFSLRALLLTLGGFAVIVLVRLLGVRRIAVYAALALATWWACLQSGIHPTVAGVLLGLLTPATPWLGDRVRVDLVQGLYQRLSGQLGDTPIPVEPAPTSPLERLQRALHPWVAFGVMPLFALANAGVAFDWRGFAEPIKLAVAVGLIVGKPLGIVGASWLSVRWGLAKFPKDVAPLAYLGIGCLAGIGFTMSLFIARLALDMPYLDHAKLGIMSGSIMSAILGVALLWRFLPAGSAQP